MASLVIEPSGPLRGRIRVPGDKSISHRLLLLAALADGISEIHGISDGDDVRRTRTIIQQLGAVVEDTGHGIITISGGELHEAEKVLDVGNSGTSIRLLTGFLSGLPFDSVLDGDQSIRDRPMDRIIDPLHKMGAEVQSADGLMKAPLTIRGRSLSGIEYQPPVASAQVKGCLLFAGLSARGPTTVVEPLQTRAHSEELFAATGISVVDAPGRVTVLPGRPNPFHYVVEGDPSQAAFWVVAASIVPGSEVTISRVYSGPARSGYIKVLQRMGASVDYDHLTGDLTIRSAPLTGTLVEADEIPGLIDEIPVLAVAAACARGETYFEGVGELKVKESDRLAGVEEMLTAMAVSAEVNADALKVTGGKLEAAHLYAKQDHRMAMAGAIAALVVDGPVVVEGWEAVTTSYPGFVNDLETLRSEG